MFMGESGFFFRKHYMMLFPPSPLLQPPRGQVVTIVGYTAKTQYRKFESNIPRK
jgi:hypothetical protein